MQSAGETNLSDIEIKLNLDWQYYNGVNINLLVTRNLFRVGMKIIWGWYEDDMKMVWRWYEDDMNMKKDQTLPALLLHRIKWTNVMKEQNCVYWII